MTVGKLSKAYKKAVSEGKAEFEVEGFGFVTDYAKYLLEYAEMRGLKAGDNIVLQVPEKKEPQ